MQHLRRWPWPKTLFLVGFAVLLAGLAVKFHKSGPNEWDDVYREAAQQMRDGADLYQAVPLYTYPPFMAWAIIPFTYLDVMPARALWFAVNGGCLAAMVWLAWRLVAPGEPSAAVATAAPADADAAAAKPEPPAAAAWFNRGLWAVFAFGLFLGLRPGTNSVLHHQTDLALGALLLLGLLAIQRKLPHLGSISFGLAAAMKCTPLLSVVYYLWRGPRLAAVTLVAVALGANFLPQLTNPPPNGSLHAQTWFDNTVVRLMKPNVYPGAWNVDVTTNQSFAGSVNAWMRTAWNWTDEGFKVRKTPAALPPLAAKAFVYAFGLLVLGVTLWLMRKTAKAGQADRLTQTAEFSCFLLVMLLMSPMSHRTHFTPLLLPAFVVGLHFKERPSRRVGAFLVGVLLLQLVSLRLFSIELSMAASWCGAQMLTTLLLLFCCWFVIEERLPQAATAGLEIAQRPTAPVAEPQASTEPEAEAPAPAAAAGSKPMAKAA